MKSMYNWLAKHVHAPYGIWLLALAIFIEGFFIVPVTTILTFFCLENRNKTFLYAAIATFMTILGAITGYGIGLLIWKFIGKSFIYYFMSPETFEHLVDQYKHYQAITILLVSLTPIPFKALTITAGFCQLPVLPFLFFTVLARGIKFFGVATAVHFWGHHVKYYLDKYFYYFVALFFASFILIWWLLH